MDAPASDAELDIAGERLYAEYQSGVRDFSNRQVSNVRLEQVDLLRCDFSQTHFTNCIFAEVTFNDGVFDGARFESCNVTRSNFHRASLKRVDFNPSAFRGANFLQASLGGANFLNCNASGAYFGMANLSDANLWGGRFSEAWFLLTNLNGSTLVGGDFDGALVKFFNIISAETIRKNALLMQQTLGRRKEMQAILAGATSNFETLAMASARNYLPEGEVPMPLNKLSQLLDRLEAKFEGLRRFLLASGCDPDEVAMMGQAAGKSHHDYPRVFISYSSNDEAFAERLFSTLTAFGVEAWFAPDKMRGGRKIHEQLEEAIAERDKVILVLSESSMKSRWVASELQWAAAREFESDGQLLFPIRIVPFQAVRNWTLFDADLGQDIAKYVRQYFVPDFSAWRDEEALARVVERFLSDLRSSSKL